MKTAWTVLGIIIAALLTTPDSLAAHESPYPRPQLLIESSKLVLSSVAKQYVILDARDGALHHLALKGFVLAAEAFVEEGREIVAGRECRGRHECVVLSVQSGLPRGAPPWRTFTCGPGSNAQPRQPHAGAASVWKPSHAKERVPVPALPGHRTRSQVSGLPQTLSVRRTVADRGSAGAFFLALPLEQGCRM